MALTIGNTRHLGEAPLGAPNFFQALSVSGLASRRLRLAAETDLDNSTGDPSRAYVLDAGWIIAHRMLQSGAR